MIERLIDVLAHRERVFVQPHNYPDHDAIASAFALQDLLGQQGVPSRIVYAGQVQRDSLRRMIGELGIEAIHVEDGLLRPSDAIVIVDGCKGNRNVTDLVGDEVAVIDHHQVHQPEDVPIADIRPDCGACATIIYTYYRELGLPVPRAVATAFMIGINMDTALLTRGVDEDTLDAYTALYALADISLQTSILRNYIQRKDLNFYRYAIDHIEIIDRIGFCYFPEGCDQNLLGILGDFFLALKEVDFVILCARNDGVVNISTRNERAHWDASHIIQDVLHGIGFGGGHADMAGGIIKELSRFNEEDLQDAFLARLRQDVPAR